MGSKKETRKRRTDAVERKNQDKQHTILIYKKKDWFLSQQTDDVSITMVSNNQTRRRRTWTVDRKISWQTT